jgi:hypothetical protein
VLLIIAFNLWESMKSSWSWPSRAVSNVYLTEFSAEFRMEALEWVDPTMPEDDYPMVYTFGFQYNGVFRQLLMARHVSPRYTDSRHKQHPFTSRPSPDARALHCRTCMLAYWLVQHSPFFNKYSQDLRHK